MSIDLKSRQDAWTDENDLLLAETVLRHVREGSTQLNAFEEVGDLLNRTSAACGFRWNAVIRHKYEKALQVAKKFRKDKKRAISQTTGIKQKKNLLYTPPTTEMDYEIESTSYEHEEIPFIKNERNEVELQDFIPNFKFEASTELVAPIKKVSSDSITMDQVIQFLRNLKVQNAQHPFLEVEHSRLQKENRELRNEIKDLQSKVHRMEDEANSMHEDYDTLMKILNRARKLVLFEEEEHTPTAFRMDKNGNLEKIAE